MISKNKTIVFSAICLVAIFVFGTLLFTPVLNESGQKHDSLSLTLTRKLFGTRGTYTLKLKNTGTNSVLINSRALHPSSSIRMIDNHGHEIGRYPLSIPTENREDGYELLSPSDSIEHVFTCESLTPLELDFENPGEIQAVYDTSKMSPDISGPFRCRLVTALQAIR